VSLTFTSRAAMRIAAGIFALAVAWPAQAQNTAPSGPKKTISVTGFEAAELAKGGATPEELTALLVNALVQDGRFIVVERAALPDVQAEQTLQQNGQSKGTVAQTGHVVAASAIVRGTVTKFEPATSGSSLGIGILGAGNLGGSTETASVTISLRVIDPATSQILYVGDAEGHATTKSVQVSGGSGIYAWNGGAFLKTPLGEALQDAIRKCVDQIAVTMAKVPWSAQVIETDGTSVYITAGADQGIQQGEVFHIYRKGKELTDPATGAVLDVLMDPVGTIQVQSVHDKVSVATITGGKPPARGDIVKMN
jgi:curli biogenesis system outer membrane secretion channel CsgG